MSSVRDLARRHGVWLLGGTFPERIDSDARVHNTSVLVSPQGAIEAVYRKIHLFDVDLSDSGGGCFRESAVVVPGDEVVVAETPFGPVGLSVCYDLRFPELYRRQAERGARWLAVPSAFAPETGRDHWEVLLRARAIENQAFVVAPGPVRPPQRGPGQLRPLDDRGSLGPGPGPGRGPPLRHRRRVPPGGPGAPPGGPPGPAPPAPVKPRHVRADSG